MAKITYLDPNEDAPKVEWHGIKFIAHKEVDLDDTLHAALIEMAKSHPYFKVAGRRKAAHEDEPDEAEQVAKVEAELGKPHWEEDPAGSSTDEPAPRRRRKKDTW